MVESIRSPSSPAPLSVIVPDGPSKERPVEAATVGHDPVSGKSVQLHVSNGSFWTRLLDSFSSSQLRRSDSTLTEATVATVASAVSDAIDPKPKRDEDSKTIWQSLADLKKGFGLLLRSMFGTMTVDEINALTKSERGWLNERCITRLGNAIRGLGSEVLEDCLSVETLKTREFKWWKAVPAEFIAKMNSGLFDELARGSQGFRSAYQDNSYNVYRGDNNCKMSIEMDMNRNQCLERLRCKEPKAIQLISASILNKYPKSIGPALKFSTIRQLLPETILGKRMEPGFSPELVNHLRQDVINDIRSWVAEPGVQQTAHFRAMQHILELRSANATPATTDAGTLPSN